MTHSIVRGLLAGVAALAFPALAAAQSPSASGNPSGPTAQDYMKDSGSNWILPAGNYSGNRQISEGEIGPDNVGDLKKAWTFKLPDDGPIESSPIVWNGTIYITSNHDDIYAVDAETGKLDWQYNPKPMQLVGFPRNRGVALMNGTLYIAMIDGHLAAVDAKTGKEKWNKQTVANPKNSFYTMQPVPYKDELLLGVSDGDWGGIGNISAFSPKDGSRLWKWESIPKPGEKGHDSWSGDSWKRGCGAIWNGLAVDPKTDTLYVTVGNPCPDFLGKPRQGDNLYTNSMVALDISGKQPTMKWFHQFRPHDTHDWDPAMPPVLFTGTVDGKKTKLAAAGDKGGTFWILNAETGKLVSDTPVSYQMNQNSSPPIEGTNYACPNTNGGVEFNGGAFDPSTNTFFVPSTNQCGKWTAAQKAQLIAGQFYLGGSFPSLVGPNSGWFNAIDVGNGIAAWRHHLDLPANGGALVMDYNGSAKGSGSGSAKGASLVFTGLLDGHFNAYDTKTGKVLWSYDTGASIIAPPATFTMNDHRYLLVSSGDPGFLKVSEMTKPAGPAHLTAFVEGSSNSQAAQ
ncbi:pyrroloquinoline quinone-dependent dehydrogenase [Jiella sp. M17.18]|uniref:pyrroloquinoline quinone-dependent dehydrogenase n=1 Tax=Jiella sp. M17.18 TaxID=3234247 RepID=UPI0034DEF860